MRKEERRGFSSPDFSAGCQNITQDGRSSRQHDKGIGVRAGGGCARNDCRCERAGETLTANRLNGRFQSRLRSLYNLWAGCEWKQGRVRKRRDVHQHGLKQGRAYVINTLLMRGRADRGIL